MAEPASIRSNNPGAMWGKGNKIAAKWGSTKTEGLNDGLGQGNNIAYFPTKVDGACAQFDLWRTSYVNMSLAAAIRKWSGGNWSQPYADFLKARTGLSMSAPITRDVLAGPAGIQLLKAQAQWEAGKPYPMTDAEWAEAQRRVFKGSGGKVAGGVIAVGTAGATAAHFMSGPMVAAAVFSIAAVAALVIWIKRK